MKSNTISTSQGRRLSRAMLAAGVAVSCLCPVAAIAQAAPSTAKADTADNTVVVVTVRRREERAQDVPVAVTALSGQELTNRNIATTTDLQYLVPSMSVSTGVDRDDTTFAIRGMGPTGGSGPGATLGGGGSGVVSYFAEVPVAGTGPGLFYDLDSVQVLEGPQGTLFGKNTTGGAILFTPKRPTQDFGGYVEGEAGNYNMHGGTLVLNVPLVKDVLALRFAAQDEQRDGYTTDRGPDFPGKTYDNRDYASARLGILYTPTDFLENYTVVSLLNSWENGDGFVLSAVDPNGGNAAQLEPLLAQQQAAGPRTTSLSTDEIDRRKTFGVFNTTKWKISDDLQIKNIASYQDQKWQNAEDFDGTTLVSTDLQGRTAQWHTQLGIATEELQAQGKALDGKLNMTGGAYYEHDYNSGPQPFLVHADLGAITVVQNAQTNSAISRGAYAQATLDLGVLSPALDKFKFTAGYRYTWDTYNYGVSLYSPSLGNLCFTTFAGDYPASNCFIRSSGKSSGESWNLSLDYHLQKNVLLYVRSGHGYVPGGFNPPLAWAGLSSTPQYEFQPETATDGELGAKTNFHIGEARAQVNADVFQTDFDNIQRYAPLTLYHLNTNYTVNASKAVIHGFEFQGNVQFKSGFRLETSYSFNDGEYTRIDAMAAPSLVGAPFSFLPKDKLTLTGAYRLPADPSTGQIDLRVTYAYQSRFFDAPVAQPLDFIEAYGLWNGSVDWNHFLGSKVDLDIFVTNAANKVYRVGQYGGYTATGEVISLYGEPRMFGVKLKYSFGS